MNISLHVSQKSVRVSEGVSEWLSEWVSERAWWVSGGGKRLIFAISGACGRKWNLWDSFSSCLEPVAEKSENAASDAHFGAVWSLWPIMLKMNLLTLWCPFWNCLVLVDRKCKKRNFWNSYSNCLEPVAQNAENKTCGYFESVWSL